MSVDRREREEYILELLARDGSLSVAALSRDLGVSEVTVRHQLRGLEQRGLLARTRGGAQPTTVVDVLERQRENEAAKDAIGAAAASLVRDGDTIMVEAGTTTARLVRHLTAVRGVQIVTNSTLVFAAARLNPQLSVVLSGGVFHRPSESMVGPLALRAIRGFNVRLAFVGTDGFTLDRGITTQFPEGAEVVTAMHEHSEETWLLADASKYGRAGFVSVLPVGDLAGLITDNSLRDESREVLTHAAPNVRVV